MKLVRRYARIYAYLKNHPFWPSLLTDGGVLTLLLILSIGFTVLCGVRSVKDISPELKVIDIDFRGPHSLSHLSISIEKNDPTAEGSQKLHEDNIYVGYSLSRYMKPYIWDEDYLRDVWSTLPIDLYDTVRVGRLMFYSNSELKDVLSVPHIKKAGFGGSTEIRDTGIYLTKTDSVTGNKASNVFVVKRTESDTVKFANIYSGEFFKTGSHNPYIYLNFRISAHVKNEIDSSYVMFSLSHKDPVLKETLNPVNIINVFPQPTNISPSYIIYQGEDLNKMLNNNGFTFLGEDLGVKRKTDRANFLWTVLFGTAIALTIDILVHLIMKWRNLSGQKKRRKQN